MSAEIKKLIDGNRKFRERYFIKESSFFEDLVEQGQRPKIMVVACSDSRVDPATIFNCKPGELFTIRNIANLVPPFEQNDTYHGTSAALEFGTRFLEVEHIIIIGHSRCGGIQALVEQNPAIFNDSKSFIAHWMDIASPARAQALDEHKKNGKDAKQLCEHFSLINSLHNLLTFSWIQERVQSGKLTLHAWYFDLTTGTIHAFDEHAKRWLELN